MKLTENHPTQAVGLIYNSQERMSSGKKNNSREVKRSEGPINIEIFDFGKRPFRPGKDQVDRKTQP